MILGPGVHKRKAQDLNLWKERNSLASLANWCNKPDSASLPRLLSVIEIHFVTLAETRGIEPLVRLSRTSDFQSDQSNQHSTVSNEIIAYHLPIVNLGVTFYKNED